MSRSQQTESWLTREGVDFTYVKDYPISKVDIRASLSNQARLTAPIDEKIVERYALSLIDGDDFPPAVLFEKGPVAVVVDGNHRVHALREVERDEIEAYVLQTSERRVIERLSRTANIRNGTPPSRDELMLQAKWLVSQGTTLEEAAKTFRVGKSTLQKEVSADRVATLLASVGGAPDRLSPSHLHRLEALKDANVLRATADLIAETSLAADQTSILITRLRTFRTVEEQLVALEAYRNRPDVKARTAATRRGKVRDNPDKDRMFRALGHLDTLLRRVGTSAHVGFLEDERARFIDRWNETQGRMTHFLGSSSTHPDGCGCVPCQEKRVRHLRATGPRS